MGIIFHISNKTPLTEGGEGSIYDNGNTVIKIYKSHVNLKSKQKKVRKLISLQLPHEVVAPIEEVHDSSGKFIGFTMEKVNGNELKCLCNNKFVKSNGITNKDILLMLVRIKKVIIQLHKYNIFIGDLNDQNILFDQNFNVYFIDCDSWSIGNEKCEVAMDLFKDPLLIANNFNEKTDMYSFAVLSWKTLTRIHPFGGTMKPDINIIDRMKKGISVIDRADVKIPRTIKSWRYMSPGLIAAFKKIFETSNRNFLDELDDMIIHLKYCDKDNLYYYDKYMDCPVCNIDAKMKTKPESQGLVSGLRLYEILNGKDITTVFDENTYLDQNGYVVDVVAGKRIKYQFGRRYYFISSDYIIEDNIDLFIIHAKQEYRIDKKFKTRIVVMNNHIYYISKQNSLIDMTVMEYGNNIKPICKCSNRVFFEIFDNKYCVVNVYPNQLIINIAGSNLSLEYKYDIINYGIHYDQISDRWLVVLENNKGVFNTYVIGHGIIEYQTDEIKYQCSLNGLCMYNKTIFIPLDGKIRGFSYVKNVFKDFGCQIVNTGSQLIKYKKKFHIINDENVYSFGE